MTSKDSRKKQLEQRYADQASLRLGKAWNIMARESPDFDVTSNGRKFGLEVARVFTGPASATRGSSEKSVESGNHKWLASILRDFEEAEGVALELKFRGTPSDASRVSIIEALRAESFALRPLLHHLSQRVVGGAIWATRAIVSRPTFMNDTVGWVSRDTSILQERIREKGKKLAIYRASYDDVRLLLVADRTLNSGKLQTAPRIVVDPCGFDVVYFYSHPVDAVVCDLVTADDVSACP